MELETVFSSLIHLLTPVLAVASRASMLLARNERRNWASPNKPFMTNCRAWSAKFPRRWYASQQRNWDRPRRDSTSMLRRLNTEQMPLAAQQQSTLICHR